MPQRNDGVCTGVSQSASIASSTAVTVTVTEQPAISLGCDLVGRAEFHALAPRLAVGADAHFQPGTDNVPVVTFKPGDRSLRVRVPRWS